MEIRFPIIIEEIILLHILFIIYMVIPITIDERVILEKPTNILPSSMPFNFLFKFHIISKVVIVADIDVASASPDTPIYFIIKKFIIIFKTIPIKLFIMGVFTSLIE